MRGRCLFIAIILMLLLAGLVACDRPESPAVGLVRAQLDEGWVVDGVQELLRGDILVKPNNTLLPGSASVPGSWDFGHAAIVTEGASHPNPDSLLSRVMIFESHARNVPPAYQLREIRGHVAHEDPAFHNTSFGPGFSGVRYRLRLNIPDHQIDSIISFVRAQEQKVSSWHSMKRFPDSPAIADRLEAGERRNWADNDQWYCSLLIWQAVLYVTGIDLDHNGGYFVYPGDLIISPFFDNKDGFQGRARF